MNKKKFLLGLLSATLTLSSTLPICAAPTNNTADSSAATSSQITSEEIKISLSDTSILVNGETASTSKDAAVYTSHDIIYYESRDTYDSGHAYGEGKASDQHTSEEAAKHTVVNITKPGTYRLSGKLSYGQIFVNVGKEEADKVTLIFDNADINCSVAPAVLFYKVYECDGNATTQTATNKVDTSNAGARVIIADNSVNHITGSHVARIYKDNADQKKLHKYDGAFYSRMSMEIDGETKGNGILNITADNEGLDTELHLTINGGHINIQSSDDGINVNEDGISVLTINGGYLNVYAGNGAEGDGIDSNGWIVINDGTVISLANPKSMDGGIDSDMGATINGGTVIGAGNMYDPLENDSNQLFMFLQLAEKTDQLLTVTNDQEQPIFAYDFPNNYTYIVFSTPLLTEGTYHVYQGGTIQGTETDGYYSNITSYLKGTQLHHGGSSTSQDAGSMNRPQGSTRPDFSADGMTPPELPDGKFEADKKTFQQAKTDTATDTPLKGERPTLPEGMTIPSDVAGQQTRPQGFPGGGMGGSHGMQSSGTTASYDFVLSTANRGFTNLSSSALSTSADNASSNTTTKQFSDVKADSWYADAVSFCTEKGLMSGTSATHFSPSSSVTREMFATILYRLAGTPKVTAEATSFKDVKDTSAYYYDAVVWAHQAGIINGQNSTQFGTGQSITLQDAVTMLNRYRQDSSLASTDNMDLSSKTAATRAQIAFLLMQFLNQ